MLRVKFIYSKYSATNWPHLLKRICNLPSSHLAISLELSASNVKNAVISQKKPLLFMHVSQPDRPPPFSLRGMLQLMLIYSRNKKETGLTTLSRVAVDLHIVAQIVSSSRLGS